MKPEGAVDKLALASAGHQQPRRRAQEDPALVRWLLISAALGVMGILVVIPTVFVFVQALKPGLSIYMKNLFEDPDTWRSITLTLTVAPVAVGANLIFGVAAAWLIARFQFPGRTLLTTLIDLPFSVSPVVAGLMFVLIFGLQGYLGPWLREDGLRVMLYATSLAGAALTFVLVGMVRARPGRLRLSWLGVPLLSAGLAFGVLFGVQHYFDVWPHGQSLRIIFATPGLILATAFVTFPFVARELIPVMEAFGAVYVVSGHIAGKTDTMPLRVEKLYQEYNLPGAFAVASLLTLLALVTLVVKAGLERRATRPANGGVPAEFAAGTIHGD